MAGFNREDWEELNITKEEVENLTQALKKDEFRKLLAEYAEEITDPKNRKQYQDDIIQLEAERGVDCTFVNPEPGFVVKTSVDGKKKAFVNICKNKAIGRPNYKRETKDDSIGLSWSIPLCQAPGREEFDKNKSRYVIYDVVFHPDTLDLASKNDKFKKLVIDTALNAVEDSFNVKLDKKNIKLPKLDFKGLPFATVIRKKSKHQPVLSEEEVEFQNTIKYPFKPPKENEQIIRNYDNRKEDSGKYTIPKYVIKHQSGIDLQEFTFDKNAKINAAIPKQLVIEINLPLLNSTNAVTLDVMEKSLHLLCEKPAKYKLDIQLPYSVIEEAGNAKFDKDRRMLIITLPVLRRKLSFGDLMKEDSGVESDSSPVGSVSNNEFEDQSISNSLEDSYSLCKENEEENIVEEFKVVSEESEDEKGHRTKDEVVSFLDLDKHYLLPSFSCNIDDDKICFVLNVKNVDSNSVVKKTLNSHACHIKFFSIGSGFFPVHYSFLVNFKEECNIEDVNCDTWDNNITVLVELVKNDKAITKYYVGLDENSLVEKSLNHPLELNKIVEKITADANEKIKEEDECQLNVNVTSADENEIIISINPEAQNDEKIDNDKEEIEFPVPEVTSKSVKIVEEKSRTLSESSIDEIVSCPIVTKSILKKRINRSLSESNAEDYVLSSSVDKTVSEGSDLFVNEGHDEIPSIKKTVRFNDNIRKQLFRVNSSILGQKKKNKKKSRNKRRAMERRLSESENSEQEDKEREKKTTSSNKFKSKSNSLIEVVSNEKEKEKCESLENETSEEKPNPTDDAKPKYGLKKDDMIFEFKSDLIFDLDM